MHNPRETEHKYTSLFCVISFRKMMQQEILLFYCNTEQLKQDYDKKKYFTHILYESLCVDVEKNPLLTI